MKIMFYSRFGVLFVEYVEYGESFMWDFDGVLGLERDFGLGDDVAFYLALLIFSFYLYCYSVR
jgi:hypothetical protein